MTQVCPSAPPVHAEGGREEKGVESAFERERGDEMRQREKESEPVPAGIVASTGKSSATARERPRNRPGTGAKRKEGMGGR